VPFAVAIGVAIFGLLQVQFAEDREDRRQSLAESSDVDRTRESALQAYLDSMSNLILEHGLLNSSVGTGVQELARAKTLTVLNQLDGRRKGVVIQFLSEARLIGDYRGLVDPYGPTEILAIGRSETASQPGIVRLTGANLEGAVLDGLTLAHVHFGAVDLSNASLRGAALQYATFCEPIQSDERGCSDLSGADLRNTDTFSTKFGNSELDGARLDDSKGCLYLGSGPACPDLNGADLRNASLVGVVLAYAPLDDIVWGNTICPDGTNSDDADGDLLTCDYNLVPAGGSLPPAPYPTVLPTGPLGPPPHP
jgi:hypothetical protein